MRETRASPDEAQWRQYLGREARDLGRGGVAAVARVAGADPRTVAKGKAEVEAGLAWRPGDRVRAPGAGRPSAERAFGEQVGGDLREAVAALVDASSYGDPSVETRLVHTSATAHKVAKEVERLYGFRMCDTTCGRVITLPHVVSHMRKPYRRSTSLATLCAVALVCTSLVSTLGSP